MLTDHSEPGEDFDPDDPWCRQTLADIEAAQRWENLDDLGYRPRTVVWPDAAGTAGDVGRRSPRRLFIACMVGVWRAVGIAWRAIWPETVP